VDHAYADGQYWDDTLYGMAPGATSAEITLYYQSTSKEFVEFLRDENTTNTKGQEMYDLWNNNGKCPPEVMATVTIPVTTPDVQADFDEDFDVDLDDFGTFQACTTGPKLGPPPAGCDDADFDGDNDVDQEDFGRFQRCLTGPDALATPGCEGS
jgi:hypothetical protein